LNFHFQRLKLTFEDLLHHTPEWRENGDRARVRDLKLDRAEIDSANKSGFQNEIKSGYQNRAMSDEAGSVSSKL
jgi:hypothetical protein